MAGTLPPIAEVVAVLVLLADAVRAVGQVQAARRTPGIGVPCQAPGPEVAEAFVERSGGGYRCSTGPFFRWREGAPTW